MSASVELRAVLRDEITQGLRGIEEELRRVAAEGRGAGAGVSSGMTSALPTVQSVNDSLGRQVAALRVQQQAMRSPEYQAYSRDLQRIRSEIEATERSQQSFGQRFMTSALPTVQSVNDSLGRQVAALRVQQQAMRSPEYQAYSRDLQRIRSEIEATERSQQSFGQRFMTMGNAVRGFMALQVVGYMKDMTMAIFDATAEMQSLKMGMTAVMKSSTLAAAEMERLKEVAKLPGLGYAEAVRMSISLQSAGFSADQARKSMAAFGNALATVGKGKADLDGVGLALTQIMSKGKVSAEEINQIAERVPQIRKAMEASFGTANTEVIQAMGLSSGQFIRGITDELGKLEKVTGGLKNGAENLSDAWFQLKANIGGSGSVFQGALDILASGLSKVNKMMEDTDKSYQTEFGKNYLMRKVAFLKGLQDEGKALSKVQQWELETTRKQLAQIKAANDKAAVEQLAKSKELTDGQKDLDKQWGSVRKKSREEDLHGAEMYHNQLIKDAGTSQDHLTKAHELYKRRVEEINEKWNKKTPKVKSADSQEGQINNQWERFQIKRTEDTDRSVAALREKFANDRIRQTERMAKFLDKSSGDQIEAESLAGHMELELWQDKASAKVGITAEELDQIAKITIQRRKDLYAWEDAARLDQIAKDAKIEGRKKGERKEKFNKFNLDEEMRMEEARAQFAEEVYQMQLKRADEVAGAWKDVADQMTGVWSSALFEMGKTNGDFYDTLSEGFTAMIGKMVADLAANAIMFGILSLIPGAGAAGAATKMAKGGGLFGALINSFAVGTKSVDGDQVAMIHDRETILPAGVSSAARSGDWRPAMAFMGQSSSMVSSSRSSTTSTTNQIGAIHVHIPASGADPQAIASAVVRQVRSTLTKDVASVKVRADAVQSRTRAGSSF